MNAIAMRCEPGYRGSGRFDCSARCARSRADRADEPLSSASLGDGKRVSSLVLRSAARDPVQILDRNLRNWICWLEAEDLA